MTSLILAFVIEAAVRASVLASVTALLLVLFRIGRASARLKAWRLMLYAAIAMPAIGWIGPPVEWRLAADSPIAAALTVDGPHATEAVSFTIGFTASALALSIYLAGLSYLLLRAVLGWWLAVKLNAHARPIMDGPVLDLLSSHAERLGLRGRPHLAESTAAWVPMTLGVLRPVVLLPDEWRGWSTDKLDVVLAHEATHIGRRDALTQRLSLLYRAVFWFNPVSWWLHRHLVRLGEQASDEAVLAAGADPAAYAATLLEFFAALERRSHRAAWHVGMARLGASERRIEDVLNWKGGGDMRMRTRLLLGLVFAVTPVTALIAAATDTSAPLQLAPVPVPVPAPASIVFARTDATPVVTRPDTAAPAKRLADRPSDRMAIVYQHERPAGVPPSTTVPSTALAQRLTQLFAVTEWVPDPRVVHEDHQEIICGLTVVRKSAAIDPRILLRPDRGAGLPVRRVEPDITSCGTPASPR